MPRYKNIAEVQADIKEGVITCEQLVDYYLTRIKATRSLNVFIEVYEEEALMKAKELDARYQENPASVGKLFGMVLSIKDVLCYKDHQVTAASKILDGFKSLFTSTAIDRLLEEDAIIIGRVNCDQFAMGSTNENSVYGPTRNGLNPGKIPGGSSGASAVSVQVDTCLVSLGTDTGGSVRQPAAFCGVVGFKPTYGRISRYGLLAYGSSFDQIGVLANSISDIALVLEHMAGRDDFDSTTSSRPVPEYSLNLNFEKKAKIAYFSAALNHESLDKEVGKQTFILIDQLRKSGHTVDEVDFDLLDYMIPAYYVLTTAEASSNLARYDGVRFGYRSPDARNFEDTYTMTRTEGFSTEVKRRIMLGTFVLSAGYYDAYYGKAQKVRRLIAEQTSDIFKEYDFILMPTTPGPAWNIGAVDNDPVAMYLADIFTVQANMVGIPAISIPLGHASNGMPIGIQLMAEKFEEGSLLAFSRQLYA